MEINASVSLAPYTTLKVGGPAAYFVTVTSIKEAQEALAWAHERALPVAVLGGGSNLLVRDEGFAGLVIHNQITGVSYQATEQGAAVTVGAGEWFDDVVAAVTAKGLWGLENLSGIPGTVGGGVVQNINAYGVTLGDLVQSVIAIHIPTGERRVFTPAECDFVYRNSFFKAPGAGREYLVVETTIALSSEPIVATEYRSATQSIGRLLEERDITDPQPADIRAAVLTVRERIGMLSGMYQSAGSFFKNPIVSRDTFKRVERIVKEQYTAQDAQFTPWHWTVSEAEEKISAAFLLECTPYNKTAFKDQTYHETVAISPVHSLSIITVGDARAADVQAFVSEITHTVEERFGVTLESEVSMW